MPPQSLISGRRAMWGIVHDRGHPYVPRVPEERLVNTNRRAPPHIARRELGRALYADETDPMVVDTRANMVSHLSVEEKKGAPPLSSQKIGSGPPVTARP